MTAPDTLAALDWQTITCQCHVHPCMTPATHIVTTHAVGHCNDVGLTADGDQIELLCDICLTMLRARVADGVWRLAKLPGPVECETCGAPIVAVGDIIRDVRRLA